MGGVEGKKDMWEDNYISINLAMPLDFVGTRYVYCGQTHMQAKTLQLNIKTNADFLSSWFFPLEIPSTQY